MAAERSYHDEWGKRLEHGFSQVIDWVWCLDAYRTTPDYIRNFGNGDAKFFAMLVIGRAKFTNNTLDQINRLKWRHTHVALHGIQVQCITFDDLYEFLHRRLAFIRGIADRGNLDRQQLRQVSKIMTDCERLQP